MDTDVDNARLDRAIADGRDAIARMERAINTHRQQMKVVGVPGGIVMLASVVVALAGCMVHLGLAGGTQANAQGVILGAVGIGAIAAMLTIPLCLTALAAIGMVEAELPTIRRQLSAAERLAEQRETEA